MCFCLSNISYVILVIITLFQTGAKSGKVKAEYKHDLVTVNSDVDINLGGPLVNASAVVGHKGWLAGYQLAFDTGKSKLTKNNFCLGYSSGDFVLHTNVNDGQVFGGSVYQKVNPNLDTAINLGKNDRDFLILGLTENNIGLAQC